jgi:hypothetical protein
MDRNFFGLGAKDRKFYNAAVIRKTNQKFHIFSHLPSERPYTLAPQTSYAVTLVAWLAMMPQLMPQQKTNFLIGACRHFCLGLRSPIAQLGALLLFPLLEGDPILWILGKASAG